MRVLIVAICMLSVSLLMGQDKTEMDQDTVVQFAGYVVTEGSDGDVIPLPYTNIGVLGTSRGTSTDMDGYFSLVAVKGETLRFSRIGFQDVDYTIPDTLVGTYFSYVQIMTEGEELLPEAVIYPWPDKDYFKYDFLAIDITNELRSKAQENLAEEVLREARYTVPTDGKEALNLETRRRTTDFQYSGQIKPQNIFSPIAWKQFIDAWRRGDFKKKKKKRK